jgi:hypothetical protein
MHKVTKIIILVLVTLFLSEATLRIQQRLGPLYDLGFETVNYDYISDICNHRNIPLIIHKWAGKKLIKFYDSDGIRINKLRPHYANEKKVFKILFMGDSFMEGFDDANTLPQHIWQYLQKTELRDMPMSFLNAGCGSYSPAIYIPQAKLIIPKLKPDFLVIDIDETDLGNDYISYKHLIERDDSGKITRVKRAPLHYAFLSGLLEIKKQPLYITRFISKIIHTRIYMPYITRKYRQRDPREALLFSKDNSPGWQDRYKDEITFFENNVAELVETLIELMGRKQRILFIHHPHLRHIQPDADDGHWNPLISSIVQATTKEYGVAFYDSTDELKKLFGDRADEYYLSEDMHFNFAGLKIYGELVAKKLLPLIR